ncbi:MAG: O-antigen ligase family protein [Candidatus Puniceispirillales bacterium]
MNDLFASAKDAWKTSHGLDRILLCFWLMGPWFFLIERSPADAWISLVGLSFLIRSGSTGDWNWLQLRWVKATGVFVLAMVISSCFSSLASFAIKESLIWIRFPLYAVAAAYWLGRSPGRLALMLMSMALTAMIMSGILLHEIWLNPQKIRLEGPYGDLVPGTFLGKSMLPLAVVTTVLAMRAPFVRGVFIGLIPFGVLIMTLLTGERMNTGVMAMAIILSAVFSHAGWQKILGYAVLGIIGTAFIFLIKGDTVFIRTFVDTGNQVGDYFNTAYWASVRPGVIAAMEYPWTGMGIGTHRFLCEYLPDYAGVLPGVTECHTHNHQFYIQMMAEGGVFTLIAGVIMVISILFAGRGKMITSGWMQGIRPWVIPFVVLMPQTNADFFGQWHNCFMWFSIGFAMALAEVMRRKGIATTS